MQERRRHQRIRFAQPPTVTVLFARCEKAVELENLSVSGAMIRLGDGLKVGASVGLLLSLPQLPLFETVGTVANRVGDLLGVRFRPAPFSSRHLERLLFDALGQGIGSTASLHEINGRRVLRISGGLNSAIESEIQHFIERVGVDDLNASEVTAVDTQTLAKFFPKLRDGQLRLIDPSPRFKDAYAALI